MVFALFTKVNGRWRFEGFTIDPDGSARASFIRAVESELSDNQCSRHTGTSAYKIINLDE